MLADHLINQLACSDCGARPLKPHERFCREPARLARELSERFCRVDTRGASTRERRWLGRLEATNEAALKDWIQRGGTL